MDETADAAVPAAVFAFDEFRFDVRRARLTHRGVDVPLTPKAIAVLECLVRNAGRLVDKQTLLATVWPNVVVEEANLSQAIYLLRRALGEQPSDRRYVVTVPGRGYRFAADVEIVREDQAPPGPRAVTAATAAPPPNVALARRRVGAWAASIAITLAVGAAWIGLGRGEPEAAAVPSVQKPAPTEALGRARFLFARRGPGDLERAREVYEDALATSPRDGELWAGLAGVFFVQALDGEVDPVGGLERARHAAERALEVDPSSAEGHVRLAMYYAHTGDRVRASAYCERARRLDPGSPLVLAVSAANAAEAGRLEEAVAFARRALERDPLQLATRANLMTYLVALGRLDEAEAEARRVVDIHPIDDATALLGQLELTRGDVAAAARWFARVEDGAMRAQAEALLAAATDRAQADVELNRFTNRVGSTDPFAVAEVYAFRGDADRAFEWLELATPRGGAVRAPLNRPRWSMPGSPLLASLHADARWDAWAHPRGSR